MITKFSSAFVILESEERVEFYRGALGEITKSFKEDEFLADFLKTDQKQTATVFVIEGSLNWICESVIGRIIPAASRSGRLTDCAWLFLSSDEAALNLSLSESLNEFLGASWHLTRASFSTLELRQYVRMHFKLVNQADPHSRYRRVSQIIRGLGHEFSNILFKIGARTEMAQTETDRERIQEQLDGVLRVVGNGGELVKALHSIPKGDVRLGVCNIVDLLDSTLKTQLKNHVGAQITLTSHHSDCPLIWCDPASMKQVFANLFVNAVKAMPDGGTLETTIKSDQIQEIPVVVLEFKDSGAGILSENLPRVFEFGFSAWEEKGLGLGLSISREIVEAHGGSLQVHSKPEKGASFTIVLPRAPRA